MNEELIGYVMADEEVVASGITSFQTATVISSVLEFQTHHRKRSKREDCSVLGHELTGVPLTEESWCTKCGEESHVIEKLQMRCSELYGNIET